MNDEHTPVSQPESWLNKIKRIFRPQPEGYAHLISQLRATDNQDLLDNDALYIIEGALKVTNMQTRDIMIPRSQMVCITINEDPQEFLPRIIAAGHSRYPVIGESIDEILGLLLAKDLLPLLLGSNRVEKSFDLKSVLRVPVFVPESKRLNVLLHDFRTNRNHMAVVADEYGGVAGLVTIEDILEEIVGEIEDEYDAEADTFIKPISEAEFMVKALTPIEDFNEFFSCYLNDEEFDTIGGLIMQKLGHMPKSNESVNIDAFCFKVANADNRRIRLLHVSKAEKTAESDES